MMEAIIWFTVLCGIITIGVVALLVFHPKVQWILYIQRELQRIQCDLQGGRWIKGKCKR